MAQNKFWSDAAIEPKRKYRFLLSFNGIPQWIVKTTGKPNFSVSESVDNPQYNPLDPDILLSSSLDSYENQSQRDSIKNIVQDYTKIKSINFTNVRKERPSGDNDTKVYDIENFALSYAYNEVFSRNINTEYSIKKDLS